MYRFIKLSLITLSLGLGFILSSNHKSFAGIGDTTKVQTIRYDSTMRSGIFMFPDDSTKTYQKIIMLYSMRCKNGLISNQTYPNQGCGEWDYNCYTYIVDSTQTDSLRLFKNSYVISNNSDTIFNYTSNPVYTYTQYNQQAITYTNTISEDSAIVGSGITSLNNPLNASNQLCKSQYLWTAAELTAAGLTAGDITGLKLDLLVPGSTVENLRIKIKTTSAIALDEYHPETTGYTEVYFLNSTFVSSGITRFNFYKPFNWDGISNLIIEFSFTNPSAGTDNTVKGGSAGFNAGLISTQPDAYLNADGSLSYVKINYGLFPSITDQITVALWVKGDSAKLPANTSILEGNDLNNKRQINVHLPWGNSSIYWDCGGDAAGYDRISKAADTSEIEGQWNFWAFTKNASTGVMNIYLNGSLWATGTGNTRMINLASMVVGMGITGTNFYMGSYDELSIWNKELDSVSINQIMYKDITALHPDYANLLSYYKFNETVSDTAFDSSPNGFNSEIINPANRSHTGNSLFRNFNSTSMRPNIQFVKGVYSSTVQNYPVLDSVLNNATSVIQYGVSNYDLFVIDTIFVWPAGYTYIYNESGVKIDSIAIATQNTINIAPLTYYQRRPMRMELINFITPYGKGLDLNGLIGKTWEFDVTDYAPLLKGPRFLAMSDGIYQEDNDITFVFYEGTPPRDVKSISQIWPSGSWVSPSYADIASNKYYEPRDINLAANTSMYKVKSEISGHQQNGEFDPHTHTITLNSSINFTRNLTKDCGSIPIYPQGGTWAADRQGWCPGESVDMKEYELTSYITPGSTINLDYSIPNAVAGSSNYRVNNQIVSYGAPNFSLDAAVDYIKTPSKRTEFLRINPICNEPVIAIKNTGSTTLTSLDITYGRLGGTMSVYHWTGSLGFLTSAEVTLPAPAWMTSITNEFVAMVSNPNGGTDEYAGNDSLVSAFDIPATYPSVLVFELKTNNYGYQTNYTLKDAQGNNIINRVGLGNNITYRDTVILNTDCYTVKLNDNGGDGLTWWANPGQGSGYFRIKNALTGTVLKTFNSDFGNTIYQQFTVNYMLPVTENVVEHINDLSVFPNPANDLVTVSFSLPLQSTAKIKLVNVVGKEILSENVLVNDAVEKTYFDINKIESGIYFIVLEAGSQSKTEKLIIAR